MGQANISITPKPLRPQMPGSEAEAAHLAAPREQTEDATRSTCSCLRGTGSIRRVTTDEAAELITVIADSVRDQPDQFTVVVNNIGTKVISSGGTGLSVVNSGQGIGYVSTARSGAAEIRFGEGAAQEAIERAGDELNELAAAAEDGDKRGFKLLFKNVQEGAALPPAILGSVEAVAKLAGLLL